MKRKILSAFLVLTLLVISASALMSVVASATAKYDVSPYEVEEKDIPLRLYYDEEASHGVAQGYDDVHTYFGSGSQLIEAHPNDDWERWSIPIGNGYFGANLFGRTETERIQLTEKTLANPYRIVSDSSLPTDGLNNFSETYIDFGHTNSAVTNYSRELDLETAISSVQYDYNGVTYSREYFTSYPDKALVIRLDASKSGALDFVLRPTVPYEQEYMTNPGDGGGKTGTVVSSVEGGVGCITLSGTLQYFGIDFVGLYRVYTDGVLSATTCVNTDGDTDGTITVSGATYAYVVVTMGTDYELSSETFTSSTSNKPTKTTTLADAMAKVEGYMSAASQYSYEELKARHLQDYTELFGRVTLDLNCKESDFALTTDELLAQYKNGSGSTYLEVLYFQYGRYLLIASSRSGALPANLQGAWNRYNHSPWSSGYWHNINVQMNYWPAFSTNIAETFEAYVEYNNAYMAKAEAGATSAVRTYNSSMLDKDGGNGWSIATGGYVSDISGSESIGNLGFTTQLFWEYYAYTGDVYVLREVVYPVLVSAARFITKMVKEDADGNYIAISSDSPEQYVNGVWYYTSEGTGYAQSFAYQNNYNLLLAAKELGISTSDMSHEDYEILQTVLTQIDKYDPVRVGYSGQVKEFFEEDYYGDLGEYTHRHISQLVGLYPGNVINGTTPAWLDAAKYTLTERGDKATGWGVAHRLNLWARVQDGERAYDLLEQLLKVNTATNLCDLHPPFQIDGNLGGTAGISEMLLQSHAGYVEPLAAIPSAWSNGSYTGLVARGNFEVSAAWSDGLATSFNILSKNGGELSVKYSGIENAIVTDSQGRAVSYTVSGDDVITFNTEAGETYYIWGFTAKQTPAAVSGLTLTTDTLSDSELSWNASSDAIGYNVYVAKEDAPTYTLLATTRATDFTYDRPEGENARLTFAVTAIGADGSESARSLAYRVPDDLSSPVLDVSANIIDDELQVAVKSSEYSDKFRLYSKANAGAEWSLVTESDYPIIIDNTYDKSKTYGVSAVNLYGEESEIVRIGSYNTSTGSVKYNAANIFEGAEFVATDVGNTYKHSSDNYGDYGKLTDGDFGTSTGRFSTKQTDADVLEGIITLPGTFVLGELKIYDFNAWFSSANNMGQHITVEAFVDGKWTTVKEITSTEEILKLRKSDSNGTHIVIDLALVKAQLIKIRFDTPVSGNSISINEIQCTGVRVGEGAQAVTNVFDGYKFAATNPTDGSEWKKYEYITDGLGGWSDPGRFATVSGKAADGTLDFGGKVYALSMLNIEYTSDTLCGKDIAIYVLRHGTWTKVVEKVYDVGVSKITFDLNGVEAEKVRFAVSGQAFGGNYIGISEMTCSGYDTGKLAATENILLGTTKDQLTLTGATIHPSVPNLDYAFDGDKSTRYAVTDAAPYTYSLEIALDNTYELYLMSFYPFYNGGEKSRSDDTKIEVFNNGVWTTVVTGFTIEPAYCSSVSLGGAVGSKIRITFKNTQASQSATLYEIECIGVAVSDSGSDENVDSNVFADRTADQVVLGNASVHTGAGPLTDAFDGNKTGTRFALAGAPAYATLEITLDGAAPLYTMAIYPFYQGDTVSRSNNTKIEVYVDGVWITVVTGLEIAPTAAPTTVSLGGIVAEKVRITFQNESGTTNASIYEITCTTGAVDAVDRKPLLNAYMILDAIEPTDSDKASLKAEKLAEMKLLLMDTEADADTIATYVALVNEAIDELNHVCFGGTATCQKRAVCSDCGREYGTLAPHTETTLSAVAPTCTATGLTEGKQCSVCGTTTVEQSTVAALGHSYSATVTAPTCTAGGYTTNTCSTCGDTYTSDETAAKGHTWNNCECTACGTVLPTLEKTDSFVFTSQAGFDAAVASGKLGFVGTFRDNSGSFQFDTNSTIHFVVPANTTVTVTGHSAQYGVFNIFLNGEKADLVASNGVYTFNVKEETKVVIATGDQGASYSYIKSISLAEYVDRTIVADTTITFGSAGNYKDSIVDFSGIQIGDNGGNNSQIKNGSFELLLKAGSKVVIHGYPGYTSYQLNGSAEITDEFFTFITTEDTVLTVTPVNGNNYFYSIEITLHEGVTLVDAKAPTCIEAGYGEHYVCTCHAEPLTAKGDVDALGHTEQTLTAVAPTCTATGLTEGKQCSVCGTVTVEQTVVPTIAHSYDAVVTDPTCAAGGYTTYTCSVCGDTYTADETAAIPHTEQTLSGKTPTCTESGLTEGKKCTVCGTTTVEQSEIPAYGHVETEFPAKAPTCDEDGYTEGKQCTVCLTVTLEQTVIHALGHDWNDGEEGHRVCATCGTNEADTVPEAPAPTVPKNHDECTASELELFINAILNFLRELFGLPTKCICGDDL